MLKEPPHVAGHVTGSGPVYLLKDTGQESLLAARYRLANFEIQIAEREFEHRRNQISRRIMDSFRPAWIARRCANPPPRNWDSTSSSVASAPDVQHHAAKAPRIGVWVPWADTDSIGWIRYSLDQRKVPYTYLRDEDIRAGNLRSKIDVLLYGHVDLELAEQIEGLPKAWSPDAVQEDCRRLPASELPPSPTTSPAASATKASPRFSISSTTAV